MIELYRGCIFIKILEYGHAVGSGRWRRRRQRSIGTILITIIAIVLITTTTLWFTKVIGGEPFIIHFRKGIIGTTGIIPGHQGTTQYRNQCQCDHTNATP